MGGRFRPEQKDLSHEVSMVGFPEKWMAANVDTPQCLLMPSAAEAKVLRKLEYVHAWKCFANELRASVVGRVIRDDDLAPLMTV